MTEPLELDPRWEWIETYSYGSASPTFIRGHCRHMEVVAVDSTLGETVASLCLTCDAQLPSGRASGKAAS